MSLDSCPESLATQLADYFWLAYSPEELGQALAQRDYRHYRSDPVGYAKGVLGVDLWERQKEALESLLHPPYKTMVLSGHNVGKSYLAAVATSWWYDTRNPGVTITTAPTAADVRQVIWKEIRLQRMRAGLGGFNSPKAPELWSSPDHYALGRTAGKGESWQGRHDADMLFVFDECVGIDAIFWETTKTMHQPDGRHAWLAIGNPTDTTSAAYMEAMSGNWQVITMSCLDHPNVQRGLRGLPPEIAGAVTVEAIHQAMDETCEIIYRENEP